MLYVYMHMYMHVCVFVGVAYATFIRDEDREKYSHIVISSHEFLKSLISCLAVVWISWLSHPIKDLHTPFISYNLKAIL